jgi:hypothetical protein
VVAKVLSWLERPLAIALMTKAPIVAVSQLWLIPIR